MCSEKGFAVKRSEEREATVPSGKGKKIAVVGVGNVLMGDEGVGVAVMRALEKRMSGAVQTGGPGDDRAAADSPVVMADFIDAGTGFFIMVSDLEGYETIVIIDAANGGGEPGDMYRLGLDDSGESDSVRGGFPGPSELRRDSLSLHDFGVLESIAWERVRGKLMGQVVLFGIEPCSVELRMGLSELLEAKLDVFVDRILNEIASLAK